MPKLTKVKVDMPVGKIKDGKHEVEQEQFEGEFLDWGVDTDEGMGSFTTAIIRLEDGSIRNVYCEYVRFV